MNLKLGTKYKVPHGTGTLVGREITVDDTLIDNFYTAASDTPKDRYIFKLDEPNLWGWEPNSQLYYTWEKNIEPSK